MVLSPLVVFQLMKVVDTLLAQWRSSLMNLTQRNKGAFDLADCLELFLNGQKVSLCKVTSWVVCGEFTSTFERIPTAQAKFQKEFNHARFEWKEIYQLPFKVTLDTRTREFQYKILAR